MPDPLIDLARFEGGIRQQGAQSLSQAVGSAPALALDAYNRMQDQQMKRVAFAAQMTADRLKNEALTRNMENADRELRLRMEAHQERLASMQTERALHEEQLRRTKEEPPWAFKEAFGQWLPSEYDESGNIVSVTTPDATNPRGQWRQSRDPKYIRMAEEGMRRRALGPTGGRTAQLPPAGEVIFDVDERGNPVPTLYGASGRSTPMNTEEARRAAMNRALGVGSERPTTAPQMQGILEKMQSQIESLQFAVSDPTTKAMLEKESPGQIERMQKTLTELQSLYQDTLSKFNSKLRGLR